MSLELAELLGNEDGRFPPTLFISTQLQQWSCGLAIVSPLPW